MSPKDSTRDPHPEDWTASELSLDENAYFYQTYIQYTPGGPLEKIGPLQAVMDNPNISIKGDFHPRAEEPLIIYDEFASYDSWDALSSLIKKPRGQHRNADELEAFVQIGPAVAYPVTTSFSCPSCHYFTTTRSSHWCKNNKGDPQ